jgi:ribosomal protein S2
MASKRGPESFMKRQRERQKQQEQLAKAAKRRERSAQKNQAKLDPPMNGVANLDSAPLGPVQLRVLPNRGPL